MVKAPFSAVLYEEDSFAWMATGKRDQLIAAGACTAAHFPPGKKRHIFGVDAATGRDWTLTGKRGGSWTFSVWRTKYERDEFSKQALRRNAHLAEIETMPNSEAEWRSFNVRYFRLRYGSWPRTLRAETSDSGYGLSADAVRAIEALLERAIMGVVNADVKFDVASRERHIAELLGTGGREAMPKLRAPLQILAGAKARSAAALSGR